MQHGTDTDPAAGPRAALSTDALVRAATTYLARRAASTAQLRAFLLRRAARMARDQPADRDERQAVRDRIEEAVARIGRAGLLDDMALARTRASALVRKGLPARRLGRTLAGQGLDPRGPGLAHLPEIDDEAQALRYAERKRLGPFASGRRAPSFERDLRALVRAGFPVDLASRVLRELSGAPAADQADRRRDADDGADDGMKRRAHRPGPVDRDADRMEVEPADGVLTNVADKRFRRPR